jgi:hypothetical protein
VASEDSYPDSPGASGDTPLNGLGERSFESFPKTESKALTTWPKGNATCPNDYGKPLISSAILLEIRSMFKELAGNLRTSLRLVASRG